MEEKEEKKVKKISLSTFFLILAIIAIIIMGIFIFKLNNEKTEETKKSSELQSQVNTLNNTVTELQGTINSISETISSTKKDENKTSTSSSASTETSKNDYNKYLGTWVDNENNEFIVRNIGNDLITFTWSIYRIASIDDVTLPFKNNKAIFYYHGYDDKNYNDKNDDDEFYCRKATVELKDNSISIKVENSTLAESNENISQDKTDLFGGGSYIQPGQYNFTTQK